MTRTDRDRDRYRYRYRYRYRAEYSHANGVAQRKAQQANGLFLRADELASLQYHLRRDRAGVTGDLARHVTWLLKQHGIEPTELRAAHPFERPLTIDEMNEHPSARCTRCDGKSVEIGGGYHQCRKCRHGWLMVKPDEVALKTDPA